MKIGIIGLLPDQAINLANKLPDHDLHFLPRERESGSNISRFAEGCSKVVLVTKFISHHTSDKVPHKKRVLITGGGAISSIVRYLTTQPGRVKITPPVKPKAVVEDIPMPKTPTQVALDAKAPAAATKVHHVTVRRGKDGKFDYSIFNATEAGDVVRFMKPADVSDDKWYSQITSARTYYRRHYGIITECVYSGQHVDVTVTATEKKAVATEKKQEPAKAAEEPAVATTPTEKVTLKVAHLEVPELAMKPDRPTSLRDWPFYRPVQLPLRTDHVHVANASLDGVAVESAFAPPDAAIFQESEFALTEEEAAEERELWRATFLARINPALTLELSAMEADKAVQLYRLRFKHPK